MLLGPGVGLSEVASNVDGAVVEREFGRLVLPALHGCYSLGTVVGAALGVAGAEAGFPVPWHLTVVLLLVVGLFAFAVPGLRPGTGRSRTADTGFAGAAPVRERRLYLDWRLLLIGGVVRGMTLAEGTTTDWLPLLMVDGHDMPPASGRWCTSASPPPWRPAASPVVPWWPGSAGPRCSAPARC